MGKLPKPSSGAVLEEPRNLPARCFWHTRQARCRHVSDLPPDPLRLGRRRRIPAVGFSRATNKLHAVPPWRQEWIATRPSSGPSIWAALLHRTVVRSGLQRHRKVSRLRMAVELPATATPPHGVSARATTTTRTPPVPTHAWQRKPDPLQPDPHPPAPTRPPSRLTEI